MLLIPATTERNPMLAWPVLSSPGCGYDCATRCKRHLLPISKQSPPAASLFLVLLPVLFFFFGAFLSFWPTLCVTFLWGKRIANCEMRLRMRMATSSSICSSLLLSRQSLSDDCGSSVCHTNQFMADQRLNNFCLALCNWRADNYAWQACSTALDTTPPASPKKRNTTKPE